MPKKPTMVVTVTAEAQLPMLPNFIIFPTTNSKVDVADLADEDLAKIGDSWSSALVIHAKQRRKDRDERNKKRRERRRVGLEEGAQ